MEFCIGLYVLTKSKLCNIRGEFGIGSILSIAVALIVSAFVLVPQMKSFAELITTGMTEWWTHTIHGRIFPTSNG